MTETPLLDGISTPADLRKLPLSDLPAVVDELRHATIDAVSRTGGHLGAGLGVVELTVALHYVFDTPDDILIWDVGHQCYPHKILTERRDRIYTLRQEGGLSGFTKRAESRYDPFGAAHSSTSISSALGFATARDLSGSGNNVIAIMGDGAMSAGMAYEAMNNAGASKSRMMVVLNDNRMSIAPAVGALNNYLTRLLSSRSYLSLRGFGLKLSTYLPKSLAKFVQRVDHQARGFVTGGTLFEEMGFFYTGPIDGHDVRLLVRILRNLRDGDADGPILLHCVTEKGKGYAPAEQSTDKYHGVSRFNVITGDQEKGKAGPPSYTGVFADALSEAAKRDERIVAVTAAMPDGTGLDRFADMHPGRCFDVGIAEQHAVTFCAGLAAAGHRPFAAIYSTFLQRAYDQVVHDVAIQKLPVRFAIDRAGLVGADGATHAGAFDIAYLRCLPGMVVMAAGDEAELVHMVHTAAAHNEGPIAFRYPRGSGTGIALPETPEILTIGRGRILREGNRITLLSLGGRLSEAIKAADRLAMAGYPVTLADARFAKPLDTEMIERLAREHEVLLTIEEGAEGGFGSAVLTHLASRDMLQRGPKLRTMHLPDRFQDQASPERMYEDAGLDAKAILRTALDALDVDSTPYIESKIG